MGNGRFNVAVSFDERRGYVGTHPELRSPVTALSLGGLRRKVEIALLPEVDVDVRLVLDRGARLERDRRRIGTTRERLSPRESGSNRVDVARIGGLGRWSPMADRWPRIGFNATRQRSTERNPRIELLSMPMTKTGFPRAVLFELLTALLDSWSLWDAVAGSQEAGRAWRAEYLRLTYGCGAY